MSHFFLGRMMSNFFISNPCKFIASAFNRPAKLWKIPIFETLRPLMANVIRSSVYRSELAPKHTYKALKHRIFLWIFFHLFKSFSYVDFIKFLFSPCSISIDSKVKYLIQTAWKLRLTQKFELDRISNEMCMPLYIHIYV